MRANRAGTGIMERMLNRRPDGPPLHPRVANKLRRPAASEEDVTWSEYWAVRRRMRRRMLPAALSMMVAIFIGLIMALRSGPQPGSVSGLALMVPALMIVFFAIAMKFRTGQESRWHPRSEVPANAEELTPIETAYVQAVQVVHDNPNLDPTHERELIGRLDSLIDEDERLRLAGETLADALAVREQLGRELQDLRERLRGADDPPTRAALERSLELCERRSARLEQAAKAQTRLESQRTVIRHTILNLAETLRTAGGTSSADFTSSSESLRETLSAVQSQTTDIERAVEEVRAIGS